jgi:hypothetical protein
VGRERERLCLLEPAAQLLDQALLLLEGPPLLLDDARELGERRRRRRRRLAEERCRCEAQRGGERSSRDREQLRDAGCVVLGPSHGCLPPPRAFRAIGLGLV